MKKEDINTKLKESLCRFYGTDALSYTDIIFNFRQKLEFLFDTNRYNKLLKLLFSSNERTGFDSYVFEVLFAYDFESKGHKLDYEPKDTLSPIDFCYKLDDRKKVYFEVRFVYQRDKITQSIETQLKNSNIFEYSLDGTGEKNEIMRLQNLILSKCQDENGKPIKFGKVKEGTYNFIVAYISELNLNMFDRYDCKLAMYGDPAVGPIYKREIFGLCQELPQNAPDWVKKYYDKHEHFRNTIHGVLFVKNRGDGHNKRYIDLELEYLFIGNNNLLSWQEFSLIEDRLSSFLQKWTDKEQIKSSI